METGNIHILLWHFSTNYPFHRSTSHLSTPMILPGLRTWRQKTNASIESPHCTWKSKWEVCKQWKGKRGSQENHSVRENCLEVIHSLQFPDRLNNLKFDCNQLMFASMSIMPIHSSRFSNGFRSLLSVHLVANSGISVECKEWPWITLSSILRSGDALGKAGQAFLSSLRPLTATLYRDFLTMVPLSHTIVEVSWWWNWCFLI